MKAALELGASATIERQFSAADVAAYAALAGYAAPGDDVPEPLINGLFSYLLGVELPGQGTNYLKQDTHFLGAPKIGETLEARVEITRIRSDKHLVDLRTTCHGGTGKLLAEGRALVFVADVGPAHST